MSIYKGIFSTQWSSGNIEIHVKGGILMSFYIKLLFKNWSISEIKPSKKTVLVEFDRPSKNVEIVKTTLFSYQRIITEKLVRTRITKINIPRACVRSMYKFIVNRGSVVGIPELYMSIIRKSIIEPLEYNAHKDGFSLIHASSFMYNKKTFVIVAGSKIGKSTLILNLTRKNNVNVLSDNYCFINGNIIRTIEEPFRSGRPKRFKTTFYNRSISGRPDIYEGKADFIIHLKRGVENSLNNLNAINMQMIINEINEHEKEGINYITETDPIWLEKQNLNLSDKLKFFTLSIAEGIENVEIAINQLKKLA